MSSTDSTPGFVIGFTLGAVIGLAVAFLLAPQSGKETRELVKDRVGDIPETIKEHTADRKKVYTETWEQRKGQPRVSDTYFEQ